MMLNVSVLVNEKPRITSYICDTLSMHTAPYNLGLQSDNMDRYEKSSEDGKKGLWEEKGINLSRT